MNKLKAFNSSRYILFFFFYFCSNLFLIAQENDVLLEETTSEFREDNKSLRFEDTYFALPNGKKRILEIGLNITSVISSFVGNESGEVNPGNFPIVFKLGRNNNAFRFGFGGNLKKAREESISIFVRNTNTSWADVRLGYELRKVLTKRWMFYGGFDLLLNFSIEKDDVITNIDRVILKTTNYGFGGGPVYGLQFALNSHLLLAAEGSLYGLARYNVSKSDFTVATNMNDKKTSWLADVEMSSPKWLYLIVRF